MKLKYKSLSLNFEIPFENKGVKATLIGQIWLELPYNPKKIGDVQVDFIDIDDITFFGEPLIQPASGMPWRKFVENQRTTTGIDYDALTNEVFDAATTPEKIKQFLSRIKELR